MSTLPLETAAHPEQLRRVVIEPLSRVEGHGKVTLLMDEDDHVQQARLHIVEFRAFEKFIQGRPYWEVPVMVQRLCGICPVSHHLAACKALDQVVGATTLTPTAEKIRRLMHYGQILQSHALHFFHLSSPDLLFGFGSDVARRNIVGVAAAYPDVARQGVLLRICCSTPDIGFATPAGNSGQSCAAGPVGERAKALPHQQRQLPVQQHAFGKPP